MVTPAPARLTRAEINEYRRLHEEAKSLRRQASDLLKQAEPLQDRFLAYVRANGGKERFVRTCGFVLSILLKRAAVQWKPEYIRVAGPEAAEELVQKAEQREELSVEPMSESGA